MLYLGSSHLGYHIYGANLMPERPSGSGKNRGIMLHKIYSGVKAGMSPFKQKREVARTPKGVSGQPLSLRKGS